MLESCTERESDEKLIRAVRNCYFRKEFRKVGM
jgi:hypothetical protein